jgi:hypothetical protein
MILKKTNQMTRKNIIYLKLKQKINHGESNKPLLQLRIHDAGNKPLLPLLVCMN